MRSRPDRPSGLSIGILQGGEGRDAIAPKDRNLAVEIGGLDGQRGQRRGDRSEPGRPIEAGAGQQPNLAALDPGGRAVAVELDLMDPSAALGWPVEEGGEFRRYEIGKQDTVRGRFASPTAPPDSAHQPNRSLCCGLGGGAVAAPGR